MLSTRKELRRTGEEETRCQDIYYLRKNCRVKIWVKEKESEKYDSYLNCKQTDTETSRQRLGEKISLNKRRKREIWARCDLDKNESMRCKCCRQRTICHQSAISGLHSVKSRIFEIVRMLIQRSNMIYKHTIRYSKRLPIRKISGNH